MAPVIKELAFSYDGKATVMEIDIDKEKGLALACQTKILSDVTVRISEEALEKNLKAAGMGKEATEKRSDPAPLKETHKHFQSIAASGNTTMVHLALGIEARATPFGNHISQRYLSFL
jgi:hypothetical protein